MLTYIFLLIFISTILSYLILEFIYRILFKSKKKVSKFLVFLGSIGLIIFYYTPYSFYLEPSFHKFKEICQLDPEIYQANGGKLDEEYYNKVLGYFDANIDDFIKYLNQNKRNWYMLKKWQNNRIETYVTIVFKGSNEAGNIIKGNLDNISLIELSAWWDKARPLPAGNEGTGFFLGSVPISCIYFKKGLNNEKQRND